jgi:polyisoprenoid-binding protein YceI
MVNFSQEKPMKGWKRYATLALTVLATLCLTPQVFAADIYKPDVSHSLVGFSARHFVITKVRGKFNDFSATITYDEQDITRSSMSGTIKVASIDTDNERRDNHLRSADFFDVEKFPEITFQSKRVEKKDQHYVLIGDLTIRGVTKEIAVPFVVTDKITDPQGKTRIGFEANLRLNRQDFGVSWNKTMDNGGLVVSDTIDIEIIVEAVKAS